MKYIKVFVMIVILSAFLCSHSLSQTSNPPTEAITGFDGKTNGMLDQFTYDENKKEFEAVETPEDGLGPVYNAQSCAACHANPITGGNSQISVLRAGHFDGIKFIEHPGGSLIHSRATDPGIQEQIMDGNEVRSRRMSPSILGEGFVEAIDDNTLLNIAKEQPKQSNGKIAGQAIWVPILEAPGVSRIGRFGFKDVHASLLSFAGDAYTNEMGITTPLFPLENTSNGRSVSKFDPKSDPEESDNDDLEIFANFMRATKAPARDKQLASTEEAIAGSRTFEEIGCAICHVPSIVTLPAGFLINGGTFTIPSALGNKVIHPYSDFLLHDIGTGDGIVQNGGPETQNKIRTTPLWGLRTKNQFLHDGRLLTINDAIVKHKGESAFVTEKYKALTEKQKRSILKFLSSL